MSCKQCSFGSNLDVMWSTGWPDTSRWGALWRGKREGTVKTAMRVGMLSGAQSVLGRSLDMSWESIASREYLGWVHLFSFKQRSSFILLTGVTLHFYDTIIYISYPWQFVNCWKIYGSEIYRSCFCDIRPCTNYSVQGQVHGVLYN